MFHVSSLCVLYRVDVVRIARCFSPRSLWLRRCIRYFVHSIIFLSVGIMALHQSA